MIMISQYECPLHQTYPNLFVVTENSGIYILLLEKSTQNEIKILHLRSSLIKSSISVISQ